MNIRQVEQAVFIPVDIHAAVVLAFDAIVSLLKKLGRQVHDIRLSDFEYNAMLGHVYGLRYSSMAVDQ